MALPDGPPHMAAVEMRWDLIMADEMRYSTQHVPIQEEQKVLLLPFKLRSTSPKARIAAKFHHLKTFLCVSSLVFHHTTQHRWGRHYLHSAPEKWRIRETRGLQPWLRGLMVLNVGVSLPRSHFLTHVLFTVFWVAEDAHQTPSRPEWVSNRSRTWVRCSDACHLSPCHHTKMVCTQIWSNWESLPDE